MKRMRCAAAAAVAVAGVSVAAALPAQARPGWDEPGAVRVSAPSQVQANKKFRLECRAIKALNGSRASVRERGSEFKASRTITGGSCSMRLVTQLTGDHWLRVVVFKNGRRVASEWIKVEVV